MKNSHTNPGNWAARGKKKMLRLGYWTGAWLVTMAVATFGPLLVWQGNQVRTLVANSVRYSNALPQFQHAAN